MSYLSAECVLAMLSRPENVMSHRDGLALRSLVYHEILSAYLNYVKARGYTSMFIWACPPMAVCPCSPSLEPWLHIS